MGLFSKLFNNVNEADAAKRFVSDLFKTTQNNQNASAPAAPSHATSPSSPVSSAPSGFSWGDSMPAEENQYSFNGTYLQYFDGIFRSEFSDYDIRLDYGRYTRLPVFTFIKNGRTALVVELFSEKSCAAKLRNDCRNARIPYLRYYIDHHGWWNTKSYVITRTRSALAF